MRSALDHRGLSEIRQSSQWQNSPVVCCGFDRNHASWREGAGRRSHGHPKVFGKIDEQNMLKDVE